MHCQLLETALLNCVNFETLIATKAARVCLAAAGAPVAEFGLRRAQGFAGGVWASRAAVVGGCASTSNVLAGKLFGIPVSGTHAHSWVMSFPDELTAFREYARVMPKNCVLLVDTYDVEQGVRNAITVGLEMRERGERLAGIRIDSGDLAWLAKMARRMLDEAGLEDCGIVLSNDLDEHTIQSICDEGAQVASWGVGTKLACAYDQPTLGGVYKLSATRAAGEKAWRDCLKISESAAKLTVPGVLDVRRYYHEDGRIAGDMVYDVNAGVHPCETIIDPCDDLRQKQLAGKRHEALLHPLARAGKTVLAPEGCDALAAQARAKEGLATLDESQKRMLNPHSYPVGLERGLFERRRDLVARICAASRRQAPRRWKRTAKNRRATRCRQRKGRHGQNNHRLGGIDSRRRGAGGRHRHRHALREPRRHGVRRRQHGPRRVLCRHLRHGGRHPHVEPAFPAHA